MTRLKGAASTLIASFGMALLTLAFLARSADISFAHGGEDCVPADCIDSCYYEPAGNVEGEPCGGACSQCHCGCGYVGSGICRCE